MSDLCGTVSGIPSLRHETAVQLFHDNPGLGPYLLARLTIEVPKGTMRVGDCNLSVPETGLSGRRTSKVDRRADVLTINEDETGSADHASVIEVQIKPPDEGKWWDWMMYIALAGRRHLCKVKLLVLALRDETVRKCQEGFESGHPGHSLIPGVVGRHNTPEPDEPGAEEVADQLTMLCVVTGKYRLADVGTEVLDRLAQADERFRSDYTRIILKLAKPDERQALEEAVITKFRVPLIDDAVDKGRAEGVAKGKAEGKAEVLLAVLEQKFVLTERRRAQVSGCADPDQLQIWTLRAMAARTLDEVFDDMPNGNGNGHRPDGG